MIIHVVKRNVVRLSWQRHGLGMLLLALLFVFFVPGCSSSSFNLSFKAVDFSAKSFEGKKIGVLQPFASQGVGLQVSQGGTSLVEAVEVALGKIANKIIVPPDAVNVILVQNGKIGDYIAMQNIFASTELIQHQDIARLCAGQGWDYVIYGGLRRDETEVYSHSESSLLAFTVHAASGVYIADLHDNRVVYSASGQRSVDALRGTSWSKMRWLVDTYKKAFLVSLKGIKVEEAAKEDRDDSPRYGGD